ncbi:branched-chain amino acid ABC transporter permease [Dehalococcoidia bacterium]|nr:branched-chain amino acid ABC transporter permease [Dehalococcoidia bacterium]
MAVIYRRERLDRGIKARSDDIFALSSYSEMCYLVLPRLLPVIGLLALPLLLEGYWLTVVVVACVIALLALSWDFIASTGMVSLGQSLFFGAGGYVAGSLNHYFDLPIFLTLPLATLGGALFSTLLLLPVLRLRGIYFSVVTLVMPMMIGRIIEATRILGGGEGLSGLSRFPNPWVESYLVIAAFLIGLFGFRRLINTDYGLVMRGIRDNDRAVMSGGINIYWYKAQALFVGGAVGSFAGAFMTHYFGSIGMHAFLALDNSVFPVASAVVGGIGTFAGPVLGAFILVPISEALRAVGMLRVVFYAVLMVVFIVRIPEGIFPYLQRKYHQFERLVETGAEG